MVEFWWDGANYVDVTVETEILEVDRRGARKPLGVVKIGPGLVGTMVTAATAGLPPPIKAYSLFSAKCHNDMSCIAFAISTARPALPPLHIQFRLECNSDVIVNAWIVVSESEPQTTFVAGGQEGTIIVPACAPAVLSVAGVESTGQMWDESSRGPAAQYRSEEVTESSPLMAHLARAGSEVGTSYASPRACGDVVAVMNVPAKLAACGDAIGVICEAYGLTRNTLPKWNSRTGYHKSTS